MASSSEKETIVTNGMSLYLRDGKNANSAILVNVTPKDFKDTSPLAGIYFQKELEEKLCSCEEEIQKKQKGYKKLSLYYGFDVLSREMAEAFISKVVIDNQKNISIFWTFSRK